MTNPSRDYDAPNPTAEQLEEARRNLRRIAEYNATIDAWTRKALHDAMMADRAREAKERFIQSLATGLDRPFWLPTL